MTTKESENFYDPFDVASQKVEEPKFNSSDYDFDIISDGILGGDPSVATEEEKKKIIDPFAAGAKLAQDFHKNMKVQKVRISEEERKSMESKYGISLVNDFDDDYAIDDEEMHRRNKYWDLYKKIANARKNLRSMSDYIRVCRDAMAFLKAVAKDNVIYDEETFVEMVLGGKIKLAGFEIPRYRGKNKGNIDWSVVAKYIANPELNANDADTFDKYSSMTPDTELEISEDEYREILRAMVRDNPELKKNIKQVGNKKKIKISSSDPVFGQVAQFADAVTKKEKRVTRISDMNGSRSISSFIDDDIERITKSTRKKFPAVAKPVFEGDIMSEKDYDDYIKELEIWEADNEWTKTDEGTAIRKGDLDIKKAKNIFEEYGYDVSNMYQESVTERKDKYLEESRRSISIDKLKLDTARKELQMIEAKYESTDIMKMTSEQTYNEYKRRKKLIKDLEEKIAEAEDTRKRREKMSDKEYLADVEKQRKKESKKTRREQKKKEREEKRLSRTYKDIDANGGILW